MVDCEPDGFAGALLQAGAAIQWRRAAALGAIALTTLYALGVVLLHVPRVLAHPSDFGPWAVIAEQLALVAGGLLAYAPVAHSDAVLSARLIQRGRLLFGVCLLSFGLAHFLYVAETAALGPAWLPPSQTFWAYAMNLALIGSAWVIADAISARSTNGD